MDFIYYLCCYLFTYVVVVCIYVNAFTHCATVMLIKLILIELKLNRERECVCVCVCVCERKCESE